MYGERHFWPGLSLYMTEKQYALVMRAVPAVRDFYDNNLGPLFSLVAEQYGVAEDDVKRANDIFCAVDVTAPCKGKVQGADVLFATMKEAKSINIASPEPNKPSPFVRFVDLSEPMVYSLLNILDIYCRVLIGQFGILYENLDVKDDDERTLDAFSAAHWEGTGVMEMRNILIPSLRRAGWNGGVGIASSEAPEGSKLAYEMLKRIKERGSGYILRLTDQPLMIVEAS